MKKAALALFCLSLMPAIAGAMGNRSFGPSFAEAEAEASEAANSLTAQAEALRVSDTAGGELIVLRTIDLRGPRLGDVQMDPRANIWSITQGPEYLLEAGRYKIAAVVSCRGSGMQGACIEVRLDLKTFVSFVVTDSDPVVNVRNFNEIFRGFAILIPPVPRAVR